MQKIFYCNAFLSGNISETAPIRKPKFFAKVTGAERSLKIIITKKFQNSRCCLYAVQGIVVLCDI